MQIAINEVRQQNKSVNSVAKVYNIPEPTLRRYLKRDPEEVRLKSTLKYYIGKNNDLFLISGISLQCWSIQEHVF